MLILQSLTSMMIVLSVGITQPYFKINLYPKYGPLSAFIDFITILSIYYNSLFGAEPFVYFSILSFFVIFLPKLFGLKHLLEELENNIISLFFGVIYLIVISIVIKNIK